MRVIHLLRKPLDESTVASNAQTHGTGGINVDGTRIACEGESPSADRRQAGKPLPPGYVSPSGWGTTTPADFTTPHSGEEVGRWPANMILEEGAPCDDLDSQVPHTVSKPSVIHAPQNPGTFGFLTLKARVCNVTHDDEGGPSRFFKVLK